MYGSVYGGVYAASGIRAMFTIMVLNGATVLLSCRDRSTAFHFTFHISLGFSGTRRMSGAAKL